LSSKKLLELWLHTETTVHCRSFTSQ